MSPRRRKATPQSANAYKFPSAEKVNNPTSETALGMSPGEIADQEVPAVPGEGLLRHPRLLWNRGDRADHSRTFGPLYIHDKVSPEQFISSLTKAKNQADMFGDFNGLPEDASAKPYEYSGHWTNRLIRATAQRAMASLLYKDAMRGKVNLIYMDPPYNVSFRSNFQVAADELETSETLDDLPDDPLAIKAFRDTYRDRIHSYLNGLYEQLALGRELLAEDGSFIVQIGPDNVHEVVLLMSEVLGRENHVATIPFMTRTNQSTSMIPEIGNWLVWFAKNKTAARSKYRQLYEELDLKSGISHMAYDAMCEMPDGTERNLTREERDNPGIIEEGTRIFRRMPLGSQHTSTTGRSVLFYFHPDNRPCPEHSTTWDNHVCSSECDSPNSECPLGKKCGPKCHANGYPCRAGSQWRVSLRGLHAIGLQGRLTSTEGGSLSWKRYAEDVPGRQINAMWTDTPATQDKQYIVETPPRVLERCILMATDPGDLVLDLTCGSGAMPYQAEKWGRRWIAVDVAQVSIAITRERLITNTYPYHMLTDSPEGARRDHEMEQALLPPDQREPFKELPADHYGHDPAKGFVVERQLRISAATLAYGHGDVKPIYHPDRTMIEKNHVRVSSAFTVESDSPYRSVSPGQSEGNRQDTGIESILQTSGFTLSDRGEPDPVTKRITDSLELAGIGQPGRGGRYKVENLVTSEIRDVSHTGILVTPDGTRHPTYFYIGREDEVISAVQTRNAAFAVANADPNCKHLVMVGFGRDGDAHSVGKYRPNMTILQVAANRDLQLPWLKEDKTDSAFTIVSEPEIRIHRQPNGQVKLEVTGLNSFNPSLGIVEAASLRQVMGIMVDTEYDTESFRARLINVKQVKRNQRTLNNLRAAFNREIDQEKWQQMLTTTTIPFDLPGPGVKIAVKVIDQTGMEHMTVIDDPAALMR